MNQNEYIDYMYLSPLTYMPTNIHLECFHFWGIRSNADGNRS